MYTPEPKTMEGWQNTDLPARHAYVTFRYLQIALQNIPAQDVIGDIQHRLRHRDGKRLNSFHCPRATSGQL